MPQYLTGCWNTYAYGVAGIPKALGDYVMFDNRNPIGYLENMRDIPTTMQPNTNLVDLLAPYTDQKLWVALNEERTRVVGAGKTVIEALKEAKKRNIAKPFILRAVADSSNFMLPTDARV